MLGATRLRFSAITRVELNSDGFRLGPDLLTDTKASAQRFIKAGFCPGDVVDFGGADIVVRAMRGHGMTAEAYYQEEVTVSNLSPQQLAIEINAAAAKALESKNAVSTEVSRYIEEGVISYYFEQGKTIPWIEKLSEPQAKALLGGKGYGLYQMRCQLAEKCQQETGHELLTSATFNIACHVSTMLESGRMTDAICGTILENLARMEADTGKSFGSLENPLLVSARSGARASLPGMMDTILNIGLNDASVDHLVGRCDTQATSLRLQMEAPRARRKQLQQQLEQAETQARFWLDSYRRLLMMFGDVVFELGGDKFEHALEEIKERRGVKDDTQLTVDDLKDLIGTYKSFFTSEQLQVFSDPSKVREQVILASQAVFRSWHNERAAFARQKDGIPHHWGTAVNICEMVFGNKNKASGTGVLMTRHNTTGAVSDVVDGTFLQMAQGEDVVAGVRNSGSLESIKGMSELAHTYEPIVAISRWLEKEARDMQDCEITVEDGKVYWLQKRSGKRSAFAEVKIALDMYKEGLISAEEAVLRVNAARLREALLPSFDPAAKKSAQVLTKGAGASPGAAVGEVVFTQDEALAAVKAGKKVILVTVMTNQEDIKGMEAAEGVLTSTGTKVSHAAIMTTAWGKCCVVGASEIEFVKESGRIVAFKAGGQTIIKGDVISIDGSDGSVIKGPVKKIDIQGLPAEISEMIELARPFARLEVRANAEAHDVAKARQFGARGVGLARTEHMFLGDRLISIQKFMFGRHPLGSSERKAVLAEIQKIYYDEFKTILNVMDGHGCTIRLLDAPFHEFTPDHAKNNYLSQVERSAKELGISSTEMHERFTASHESNPMLGNRSARFGVLYPDFYEMQLRAAFIAVSDLMAEGKHPHMEIEIPLPSTGGEVQFFRDMFDRVRREFRLGDQLPSAKFGIMMEDPAMVKMVGRVAHLLDFVSYGTNDMTQTTLAISRDDAGPFIGEYIKQGWYGTMPNGTPIDPFAQVAPAVEAMIAEGNRNLRYVNPDIEIFVCGEHGGDPYSINRFRALEFTGVSMSVFKAPGAVIAAAQEEIKRAKAMEKAGLKVVIV